METNGVEALARAPLTAAVAPTPKTWSRPGRIDGAAPGAACPVSGPAETTDREIRGYWALSRAAMAG